MNKFKVGDKIKYKRKSPFVKRFDEVGEIEKVEDEWLFVKYKTNPYNSHNPYDYYDYIFYIEAELVNES